MGQYYLVEFEKKEYEGIQKWVFARILPSKGPGPYPTTLLY
jgi:hypothetical protein